MAAAAEAIKKEHCIYLEKYVLRYSTHFFLNWIVCLPDIELHELFMYLGN